MGKLITWFNYWPIYQVILPFVLVVGLWIGVEFTTRGRIRRNMDYCYLIMSILAIFFGTIVSRGVDTESSVCVVPFYSFVLAQKEQTIYRSILLNICIFVPMGLSMASILAKKTKCYYRLVIVAACVFSMVIESIQYTFSMGRAEIDDVIFNCIGATLGGAIYILVKRMEAKSGMKKRDKDNEA